MVPEFLKLPPLLNDETNSWMRLTAGSHLFHLATHCEGTVTLSLRLTSQARSLPLSLMLLTFVGVKGQNFHSSETGSPEPAMCEPFFWSPGMGKGPIQEATGLSL